MRLHTQITGEGKHMVIIHGFLGMGDNWRTLSKAFAEKGFKVHTPDMRNHGKSPHSNSFAYDEMAQDIKQYFEEHDITKAILIGHSMGGKIAMTFAQHFPQLIEKLIIVDISPKEYKPHHDDILSSLLALKQARLTSRNQADDILKEKIKDAGVRMFLLKNISRDKDNTLSVKPNIEVFIKERHVVGEALITDNPIAIDTLFIKGENSSYIRKRDHSKIFEQFTNAKIVNIANAGHWVHAENPKDFFEAVIQFLQ